MKRPLGNTGLAVEPIGLGGMPLSIQNRPDERQALAVIEAANASGGPQVPAPLRALIETAVRLARRH